MPMMLICMPPERYHGKCGRDGLEFDRFAAESTTFFNFTTAAATREVLVVFVVVIGGGWVMLMLLLRWATPNVINAHVTWHMTLNSLITGNII